ncbi:hypothetical protein ACTVCO_04580 [Sanguibacter sp. A247]|uniref:hypothetical protein n=1 Tax=unclassified Sanguibacter TaxID=2645534 RepID=UPI003FD7EF21
MAARFNPAPGWPPAPEGWTPPPGWQPDPAWPPMPQGWPLWVDDAAPAPGIPSAPGTPSAPGASSTPAPAPPTAPPAPSAPAPPATSYSAAGSMAAAPFGTSPHGEPTPSGQPGLVVPGSSRSGLGTWIAFVVALLLAVGGYLVWQGLRDDDATPAAAPAVTETPVAPSPTDAPVPPAEPAAPEPTDVVTDDFGLPSDLDACLEMSELTSGWSLALFSPTIGAFIPAADAAIASMEKAAPPVGHESAWATYLAGTKAITEHLRTLDPEASPITEMTTLLTGPGGEIVPGYTKAGEEIASLLETLCS